MPRLVRPLFVCVLAVAALALTACGNRTEVRTIGETEGLYLDIGGLKYQVQLSRYLNAADIEDRAYLKGLPQGVGPTEDETWFAIFLRVQNAGGERTLPTAREFAIKDTQEREYRPVPLDPKVNVFGYQPQDLRPNAVLPAPSSPAGFSPTAGAMLLFRITYASTQNRPLEFRIVAPENPDQVGVVDLDV